MKGILHKTDSGWVIRYDGKKELPVHPEYEKYYFLNEEDEGEEAEFEVEEFWETGMEQVVNVAKLARYIKKLVHRDGVPIRSYHSPKLQELLDEINLEEISKEQLEQERNSTYEYFNIKKNFDKFSLYEHKETITSSDTNTSSEIEKLASQYYPEYYSIGLGSDKIGFERGYNLGKSSQTEISDEEIQEGVDEHFSADDMVVERFAFKLGANWYKALLKSKKQ